MALGKRRRERQLEAFVVASHLLAITPALVLAQSGREGA
jgi:hypothetical protein